ncbi:hypothetical protein [Kaarinaea lacus]
MDYQFNKEIGRVFESADFLSDDFENFGFDEYAEDNWNEENYLSTAIQELDDSLEIIEFHQ